MRVLVVLSSPPLPEGGAAGKCAIGLMRGLQAHGVAYHALAANLWSTPLDTLPGDLQIESMPVEPPPRWRVRTDRLLQPNGWLARGAFVARLKTLAAGVDIVHFVEAQAAVALSEIDTTALVQIHCVTRRDRVIVGPWRRDGRVAIDLLRAERRACRRARWLLANSQEVSTELKAAAPHARLAVAPLMLDERYYAPRATVQSATVGLIGSADWPPTARAVARLLTDVWPRIYEQRPNAKLLLAGRGMERSTFPGLSDSPGVQWVGRVDSAADFLRELGILLYPLTAGSGAKVKVLEALALGVPVVTTPDGAEGLGALGGVAVSTDNGQLVDATVALIDDPRARRDAGAAAHKTFSDYHAPAVAARPVVDLYEEMISEARKGASQR